MPPIPKDPVDWLTLFRQQINEIFTYLSEFERRDTSGERAYVPPVDVFETADHLIVEMDLPGFDRSDLSLSMCCNTLVVEGAKREEPRPDDVSYICLERSFGRFCKTLEIPPAVDVAGVEATYQNGVLVVSFPRVKDKAGLIREIPIG
ncbi:Hsp20/alpha crystallin family protein [Geobacter sp. DSM 9736]|uniref:Hsp20/alpha crystallin family protein n=1 Tax=Geobacter sp. DSM 9736 TaxID=1277350 RepID=UPI000B50C503|nr:Hsp20/alpha crystallin family protein [Geobacter sp. DSM 9736]SNB47429.1 HSP20 family protein [Geobacter sp. DSM 9736]